MAGSVQRAWLGIPTAPQVSGAPTNLRRPVALLRLPQGPFRFGM